MFRKTYTALFSPPSRSERKVVIHKIASEFPSAQVSQKECMDHILQYLDSHPKRSQRIIDWTQKVFANSGIRTKRMAFHPSEIHKGGYNSVEVDNLASRKAAKLGKELTRKIFLDSGLKERDITARFVGTDIPSGISMDSFLRDIGCNPNIKDHSTFGKGCVGGAINLSRAYDYLQGHPTEAVQVINVDLYSRLWTYGYRGVIDEKMGKIDSDRTQERRLRSALLPAVITGDAASSMILLGERHPLYQESVDDGSAVIVGTGRAVVKDSVRHTNFAAKPYGNIPFLLESIPEVAITAVNDAIKNLKESYHVPDRLSFYSIHPGGVKVLQGLERSLGIPRDRVSELLGPSYQTLERYGNCASPTVMLALEETMSRPFTGSRKQTGILVAVGPGMMSEVLLLERSRPTLF